MFKPLIIAGVALVLLGSYNMVWKRRMVRLPGTSYLFTKHFPKMSYDVQIYRSVSGAFLCWALALVVFGYAWSIG